ncbi:TonB-dependent receptor [uncultured Flavobacterium sp.]|uniref:SusC/RagA family TonB-linked outer membrane protein n=1 Tax=uncultured Flavobacterium sp. TaxID=165435 RepID=UPI0025E59E20|nr:TonB-dependent receptor [uncultured Flavobacterium sp.]
MKINLLVLNRFKYTLALFLFFSLVVAQKTYAQNKTFQISGTVIGADDKLPLPGVSIVEKGASEGTSTDLDGAFKFNVSSGNATIVVSFMGYKTQEVKLNGKTSFNISLEEQKQTLEEVVVVGYGTVKKSDLTGSVATLSGAELKKQPISSVAEALTGRIAGVKVTSSEGSPDADISIRIRGGGSLTQDGSPLIIVDGFPVNSMNDISPSDVETITVLKDASSTAIYGSRGANGVILITTKSGKNGEKISVSYDMFTGFKHIAKTVDVLKPADYAKWQYEFAAMNNDIPSYEDYFGSYAEIGQYENAKNTNWQKEIYGRTGAVQNHNLGIRGGSDKLSYNFNYVRYDEEAIMIGSNFKRDNLSLNLKSKLSDKVDVSFTMRHSRTKIDGGGANEQKEFSSTDSRLRHVIGYAPIPIEGLTTDDTDEALAGYLVNPFVSVTDNDRRQDRRNYNMLGGINWKITKGLQFKSDFGLDFYRYQDYRFYGRTTYYVNNMPASENQGLPALIFSNRDDSRFRNANTFNYDFKKSLGNDHSLKVLLGEEMIIYKSNTLTNTIHGYPKLFSFDNAINLTTVGTPFSVNNFNNPEDKLLSFFGRINYDYKDRYLFTVTYRADGSSIFLGDNRWGYFPSAAVAWKISEESFLKDNASWLDLLKFRVSYGQAGNNNIPPGQTIRTFQSSNSTWINGTEDYWAPPTIMPNPDLKWETTTTKNIGLDYELLRGRISGSFEAYKNKTEDLLLLFNTPGAGYDSQYRNMGETENKGFEATLNYSPIKNDNYGLDLSFNIAFNKNKINSLGTMNDFEFGTAWASSIVTDYAVHAGQPIGMMYGYKNDGRYEVSDFNYSGGVYTLKEGVANSSTVVGAVVPGSMKLKDLDGNGVVDAKDRTIIGNANPKHTGGFVLNARAHNFDLSAAFNWSFGNDIYNASKIEHTTATPTSPSGQYRNLMTTMGDGTRWTNIDPATGSLVTDPTALEALNANTTMWSPYMSRFVMSDWAVEDGSFLRLNTLTLGYSMPDNFIKKLGLSRFRLYGTATNVFVITNYSGLDPEVSTRRKTPLTPGTDYSPYPRSRQFVFGINLNF